MPILKARDIKEGDFMLIHGEYRRIIKITEESGKIHFHLEPSEQGWMSDWTLEPHWESNIIQQQPPDAKEAEA